MLAGEPAHRKRTSNLSELSWIEDTAVEAPDGAGSSFWICRRLAVALRRVRNEVLRSRRAGSQSYLCALRNLRQFGIATNRRGARSGDDGGVLASAADTCVAV